MSFCPLSVSTFSLIHTPTFDLNVNSTSRLADRFDVLYKNGGTDSSADAAQSVGCSVVVVVSVPEVVVAVVVVDVVDDAVVVVVAVVLDTVVEVVVKLDDTQREYPGGHASWQSTGTSAGT
jgi:hypothetical protein